MTQEEKDLMLRDLCARLPHGVKVLIDIESEPEELYSISTFRPRVSFSTTTYHAVYVENIKPYLRPMSSMTKEEKEECVELGLAFFDEGRYKNEDGETIIYGGKTFQLIPSIETFDWLNSHHFDYHGLIEKGLALEAPRGMYK